jgi:hypothetical protein
VFADCMQARRYVVTLPGKSANSKRLSGLQRIRVGRAGPGETRWNLGGRRQGSKDRRAASTSVSTVSLVAVGVFLTVHVTIVLHVAFGEILSHIIVALDVT